jgi:hypothetical protein
MIAKIEMIEIEEAAAMLKCEPARIEELLRTGVLAGLKFGRSWSLPLEAFMISVNEEARNQTEQRRNPAPAPPPKTVGRRRPLPTLMQP